MDQGVREMESPVEHEMRGNDTETYIATVIIHFLGTAEMMKRSCKFLEGWVCAGTCELRCILRVVIVMYMVVGCAWCLGSGGDAVELYARIGRRVWMNECAGSEQGLVSWNAGENFPSMGIGHFIWYPAGVKGSFDESFPKFVAFARSKGVSVPDYFYGPAPWGNRTAFRNDKSGKALVMRRWLAAHVDIQSQFLVARSRASLGKMLRVTRNPRVVRANYELLTRTAQGLYCLIDYVNFKGEGTEASERYAGQGWGLLQVLEFMRSNSAQTAPAEFARAAEQVIRRRVRNAPPSRNEQRWLQGWLNRCKSYLNN